MSKPSAPAAPDYTGAAQAQGAANKDAAIATAQLSNPNVSTPYGSQTVSYKIDPTTGNPVPYVNQGLTPAGQSQFDQNQRINTGLGGIAEQGLGYVQNTLDKPFDPNAVAKAPVNAGTTAQDAIMARVQPQLDRQRTSLETQLTNQGLRPGTEAWKNSMTDFGNQENDQRSQAALQGIGLDTQAHQAGIQEQEFMRTEPLNILNAVRSASPVGLPQFQGYQGAQVGAAPVMQGAQAQGQYNQGLYNSQVAGQNAALGGLSQLGAAGLMSPAGTFSFLR